MSEKSIVIFGVGHLGSFLLKEIDKDYSIYGTATSKKKEGKINEFRLGDSVPKGFPLDPYCVLWLIPPRERYKEALLLADDYFKKDVPWIFVSSTSVYLDGNIDEKSQRDGKSNIIELEDLLYQMDRIVSIIRPSGLVDEKRNPKNFFKSKTEVPGGNSPINLVHTQDVARFITFLLNKGIFGEDFNLACDLHLSKKDFYSQLISSPPTFLEEGSTNKNISNEKSKKFGFQYRYPDLLGFFKSLENQK